MFRLTILFALTAAPPLTATSTAQTFQFMQVPERITPLVTLSFDANGYAAGGDLDGDGRCDLVATTQLGAQTFRGQATGWAAGPTLPCTYQRPRLVDLDGDGDRDLAFVPPHLGVQTPVLLYRNTPAGMVAVPLPPSLTGVLLVGAAVGDLDADGFAELVLAVPGGNPMPPLVLARGSPGLQFTLDVATLSVAGLPQGLWPELLDADGDGDLDVLASNATSGLRLLRNDAGTFVDATATLPAARTGHTYLSAGDFDGDGRDDCAASLGNGELDVLWGGAGGLVFARAVATVAARMLWLADFDADGDGDLLADTPIGLELLTNLGNRQFARSEFARLAYLRGVADVDGNGVDDILYALIDDRRAVRCRFQARYEGGAGGGVPPVPTAAAGPAAVGDYDGDGRTDFATPQLTLLTFDRALGGGRYERSNAPWTTGTGFRPYRSEVADLDVDGDLDLVLKDDTRLSAFDNRGPAGFSWRVLSQSQGVFGNDLRVADLDADGDPDIVHTTDFGTYMVRNLGGGQFATPVLLVPSQGGCTELADVDGDGDLDVIACAGNVQVVLANNGGGTFAAGPGSISVRLNTSSMCKGDFDGDGDPDLVVTDGLSLRVHRNNGSGVYVDTTASDLPPMSFLVLANPVVADFDADGDRDVIALTDGTPALQLLDNDGTGRFTNRSAARIEPFETNGGTSWVLRAADVDDDGDVDVLAGSNGQHVTFQNHLRHCRSNAVPRLGGLADLHVFSGPGFGQPGLGLVGIGFALASPPIAVPGLDGRLHLDPATLQVAAAVTTGPLGVSNAFVPVPPDPLLFGLELWFQCAILPATGAAGFTNAVGEVVLR